MNRKLYKKLIPAIGVGLLGGAAAPICQGAAVSVTATVTALGTPQYWDTDAGSPVNSTLLTGYTAYKVTVETSDGTTNITGIDLGPGRNIDATLHQIWLKAGKSTLPTPTGDDGWGPVRIDPTSGHPVGWDSYLIMPTSYVIPPDPNLNPAEDNDKSSSPYSLSPIDPTAEVYGQGTYLNVAYGIGADSQRPSLDIAYLVIPDSALVGGALHLGSLQVSFGVEQADVSMDIGGAVPEPASLGLLVIGAGGLLVRRRRRD